MSFFTKVLETTLLHMTAGAVQKLTERGIDKATPVLRDQAEKLRQRFVPSDGVPATPTEQALPKKPKKI